MRFFPTAPQIWLMLWRSFKDTPPPLYLFPGFHLASEPELFHRAGIFIPLTHLCWPIFAVFFERQAFKSEAKISSPKKVLSRKVYLVLFCRWPLTSLNSLCYGGGSSWQDDASVTTGVILPKGQAPLDAPSSCSALRFSQLKGKRQKGKIQKTIR